MAAFDDAVGIVMSKAIEGGHSYDEAGGDTWYGIARNFHLNEEPWPPTRERAVEIYRQEYWDLHKCGTLPYDLAIGLFDAVVNQDQAEAVKMFQRAVGAKEDGIVGDGTIRRAWAGNTRDTMARFFAFRVLRYAEKSELKYRAGLCTRVFRVQQAIIDRMKER